MERKEKKMNDPTKSYCEEFGHGELLYLGSSEDGLVSSYLCLDCKKELTTNDPAFDLSEIELMDEEEEEINKK
jgi:hypothetical protein